MLLTVPDLGKDDTYDCCVVGTGPAGMTCALSLADAGRRVLLLEGGKKEETDWSQSLYQGKVVGDNYWDLTTVRLRYFGGTSNNWAGWCRQLDEIDFTAKGEFSKTVWPITKADLDPYLKQASDILEVPLVPEDRPIPGSGLNQVQFVWSPPVSFSEKYGERVMSDERIFLVFDANLIGMETNGADITGFRIVDSNGNAKRVRANAYVLATGGIENSRLLLWCNEQTNGQIVRHPETLGKYWMEHMESWLGYVLITGGWAFDLTKRPEKSEGGPPMAFFALTPEALREDDVLSTCLQFQPPNYDIARELVAEIACVAPDLGRWMFRQIGKRIICGAKVAAVWEQEPRPGNRIELGSERDALGMPRPVLYWSKSEEDRHTVRLAAKRLGAYLAKANVGRLRLDPWVLGEADPPDDDVHAGFHHMGGTRMAVSPKDGVVDGNCKVFGKSNLYIAGSSVFPSAGYANPTLTIVQAALRLADCLCKRL